MDTTHTRTPDGDSSWPDEKAKEMARAFIKKLKSRGDRFIELSLRAASVEFTTLNEGGTACEREHEISIHAKFRKPCEQSKAERAFKELIEEVELAGYSSAFGPDEFFRSDPKTDRYYLCFTKQKITEI